MLIVRRISLRYVLRKYRDAEGAAGSIFVNLGLAVAVSSLRVCDAGGITANLRPRAYAFYLRSVVTGGCRC
jgi:hypothetical protein